MTFGVLRRGDIDTVETWLQNGLNPNTLMNGTTMLIACVQYYDPIRNMCPENYIFIIRLLIQYGANVNLPDHDDNTALHWAVWQKKPEMIDLLLKHGADKTLRNRKRVSAQMAAREDDNIRRLLQ